MLSPRFLLRDACRADLNGFQTIELVSLKPSATGRRRSGPLKESVPQKIVIVSIMGDLRSTAHVAATAVTFESAGADALELSLLLPHGMPEKGVGGGHRQHADLTESITRWVKEVTSIPGHRQADPQRDGCG